MKFTCEGIDEFKLTHDLIRNQLWSVSSIVVVLNEMKDQHD